MKKPLSPEALAWQAQSQRLKLKTKSNYNAVSKQLKKPKQLSKTQQQGHQQEQRAKDFLITQGLRILESNLLTRYGEIDIVARTQDKLVFVEVRYRKNSDYGGALYSVHFHKQQRIKQAARHYLAHLSQRYFESQLPYCRFDVIAIDEHDIVWIQDAFR